MRNAQGGRNGRQHLTFCTCRSLEKVYRGSFGSHYPASIRTVFRAPSLDSVPVGFLSCESVLPAINRPSAEMRVGYFRLSQTRQRSHRSSVSILNLPAKLRRSWLSCLAQAAVDFTVTPRNGSYTSWVIQIRCIKMTSFLATAMTALFLAFLPPRSASDSPHRRSAESFPNGPRMY